MEGIVAPRRRDGRSALLEVPEGSQPTLARGASCASVCRLWGTLTLAIEWALPEWNSRMCGVCRRAVARWEEPAECGSVRRFGGNFAGVDIGQFETPGGARNRLSPGRRTATLRRVGLTRRFSPVDMRCAGVKRPDGSRVEGRWEGGDPKAPPSLGLLTRRRRPRAGS